MWWGGWRVGGRGVSACSSYTAPHDALLLLLRRVLTPMPTPAPPPAGVLFTTSCLRQWMCTCTDQVSAHTSSTLRAVAAAVGAPSTTRCCPALPCPALPSTTPCAPARPPAGRTARAEAEGVSIALVTPKESARFAALLRALGRGSPPEFPVVRGPLQDLSLPACSVLQLRRLCLLLLLLQVASAPCPPSCAPSTPSNPPAAAAAHTRCAHAGHVAAARGASAPAPCPTARHAGSQAHQGSCRAVLAAGAGWAAGSGLVG